MDPLFVSTPEGRGNGGAAAVEHEGARQEGAPSYKLFACVFLDFGAHSDAPGSDVFKLV